MEALPTLSGSVEAQFVWAAVLGEHLLPFRVRHPAEYVLPLATDGELFNPAGTMIDRWPGLAAWMRQADAVWKQHRNGSMSLLQQIDHMKKLTHQVPASSTRVVYNKSGMHLAAAVIRDPRVVIDQSLYWAAVSSPDEAAYLVGVLNAPSLTELVRPYMSYGKDERHIDSSVWKLPIPKYDPDDLDHVRVVELSNALSEEIAALDFSTTNFVVQRRIVRAHIAESDAGRELDKLVAEIVHE